VDEIKDSEEGYQYWCELVVNFNVVAGAAAVTSRAMAPASAKNTGGSPAAAAAAARNTGGAGGPKPVAKKAAKPASGQGSGTAENEKKARTLLANFQLAANVMMRVSVAAAESAEEWAWAEGDIKKFKLVEESVMAHWNHKTMLAFIQDLRAAVFSAAAVKSFKKKHFNDYPQLLNRFVVETEPGVGSMSDIVKQIEDTAKVRGIAGFGDPDPRRGAKRTRANASQQQEAPVDAESATQRSKRR
jgi:hypothetical protein